MTENDYIICTNLAKVRIARQACADMLTVTERDEADRLTAYKALTRMMERLEKLVEEQTDA